MIFYLYFLFKLLAKEKFYTFKLKVNQPTTRNASPPPRHSVVSDPIFPYLQLYIVMPEKKKKRKKEKAKLLPYDYQIDTAYLSWRCVR